MKELGLDGSSLESLISGAAKAVDPAIADNLALEHAEDAVIPKRLPKSPKGKQGADDGNAE